MKYILLCLLILIIYMCYRAYKLKPNIKESNENYSDKIILDEKQVLENFIEILKKKTIWPMDKEIDYKPFDEFLPLLKSLYPEVFEKLELNQINKYGIVLKWKGKDSNKKSIVLMAHYDVVDVNPSQWSYPPFEPTVVDGTLYARGTVDDKCCVGGLLEAINYLLKQDFQPERDIWFSFTNNEESSGDTTTKIVQWLTETQNLDPWFVLDEGGAVVNNLPLGVNDEFAMIGVSEKGVVNVKMKAKGEAGHSSTPSKKDSTARLLVAMDKISKNSMSSQVSETLEVMLKKIASHSKFSYKFILANLWLFKPILLLVLKSNKETAAMVSTTIALTQLEGANAINIIPDTATAGYSVRIAPWDSVDKVKKHFQSLVDENITISTGYKCEPSPISPINNDAYKLISETVTDIYPNADSTPYIQNGATDSRHFAKKFKNVYRFAPFKMSGSQRAAIHGNDENIVVSDYYLGIKYYIRLIEKADGNK